MDMTPEAGGNTGASNPEMFKAGGKRIVEDPINKVLGKPPIDTKSEKLKRETIHVSDGDFTVEFPVPKAPSELPIISSELAAMARRAREEARLGWLDNVVPDAETANSQVLTTEATPTPRIRIKNKIADAWADLFKPVQRRLIPASVAFAGFLAACGPGGGAPATAASTHPETFAPPTPIATELPSQSAGTPFPSPTIENSPSPKPTESTKLKEILGSPTLRELADQAKINIASQIVSYKLDSPLYREAATEVANMATSAGELDIKNVFGEVSWKTVLKNWDYVSTTLKAGNIPYENKLNFADFDKILNFAKENNMPVMAQFLFYAPDMPSDMITSGMSKSDIFKVVEYYVKARVLKYKGQISAWNVTNEVISGKLFGDSNFKFWYASPWSDELIANVFKWAHEIDPKAQLLISENNVLEKNDGNFLETKQGFIDYLTRLKQQGVPVTTAGLQDHFWIYAPPDKSYMEKVINEIKGLGLKVMSTETTVSMSQEYPFWPRNKIITNISNKQGAQAKIYKDALQASLDTNSTFGMFGFTDAVSLFDANDMNIPDAQGLILDSLYQPKPAYKALVEDLQAYIKP